MNTKSTGCRDIASDQLENAIPQVAFNNVFVQLPMTHFFYRAHVFLHGPDTEESIRTLPSVGTVMWQARCIQNKQP